MPSPVGHALGGLAAALVVDSIAGRPRLTVPLLAGAATLAMAPDLDLLIGSHRAYTHSLGAVFVVGLASWLVLRGRGPNAVRAAMILMAAYAAHPVLDWMGKDTSRPPGLMLAWPFSSAYFVSGWNLFGEVSRRYWLPQEFVIGNLRALSWELTVLMPLVLIAWVRWSRGR